LPAKKAIIRNILKLLDDLQDVSAKHRGARFRCVIVYLDERGNDKSFVGVLPGHIGTTQTGSGGFGYDPVFYAEGYSCSLAELSAEEKNRISHRGRAMEKLKAFLHK
jgi:XTP/dITP diphosphohydrolase